MWLTKILLYYHMMNSNSSPAKRGRGRPKRYTPLAIYKEVEP